MKKPPGARFGNNHVEHMADLARRGHVARPGGKYPPGEFVRSAIVLVLILTAVGIGLILGWFQ